MTADLIELARPFPDDLVERKQGSDYVAHHVVNQRLLSIVGPFDFELVQIIRGDIPAIAGKEGAQAKRTREGTPALQGIVVGAIYRLSCTVDGRRVQVEEVGDVGDVHNWDHDGARLKDAASDALKRCAMRLGLGLHLWAQEHYFLDAHLARQQATIHELKDSLAPREQVETLLREHGRPGDWTYLAEVMQTVQPGVTVERLKGIRKAEQVQLVRETLAAHDAGASA
jgi:hypothetical protein